MVPYKRGRMAPKTAYKHVPRGLRVTMPAAKAVKLRYCARVTLNPGPGLAGVYVFSTNGMYDPDITGAGHQPLGFDQWMALYNSYQVLSSKIHVEFANLDGTYPQICGVTARSDATPVTDIETALESAQDYGKLVSVAGGGKANTSITKYCDNRLFIGRSTNDNSMRGDSSANPAEQAYWHVWCGPGAGGGDPGNLYAVVTIDYNAILTEPVSLSSS